MNPLDYGKAIADFWTASSQALLKAQGDAGKALADSMQAMASGALPGLPALATDFGASTSDLAQAGKAMLELWTAAGTLSTALAAKLPAATDQNATVEATFRKMVDPQTWLAAGGGEMEDVLARMAEGPRFADLWDVERRYARVMQAWVEVRRRTLEHNAVVLQAWLQAGRRFTEELAGRTAVDGKSPDAKAMLALWTEIANQRLLETQRSGPFLNAQTAAIRASTELRLAQQELVEHYGKQFGFPTRTELDDVHFTVTTMRRELRALQREIRALRQHQAAPARNTAVESRAATELPPPPVKTRQASAKRN